MNKRKTANRLFALTQSYFREYLEDERGLSAHTIRAYRDSVKLFFVFLSDRTRRPIERLELEEVTSDAVKAFLNHIESKRCNSPATRNSRLTALRSFCKYLTKNDLARAAHYSQILTLESKRAPIAPATYLEPEEMSSVISQPDTRTALGGRDHAMLLLLYNSGARVAEALAVRPKDLCLTRPKQVRLYGKGRRERVVPLWDETATALRRLIDRQSCAPDDQLFRNHRGEPLTRNGVDYVLKKYVALASQKNPALRRRHVSPHVTRHSCAAGLLQGGNVLTAIRDHLGHASIATTNRYLTTNLQMKTEALERFWKSAGISPTRKVRWKPKPDLLTFLDSL
jgi:integrase/recombinase XerD